MTTYRLRVVFVTGLLTLMVSMGVAQGAQKSPADPDRSSTRSYVPPTELATEPLLDTTLALSSSTATHSPSAVNLIGYRVQNLQGERLGDVETLLVTPAGRVAAIVVGTGGLWGFGEDRYQIPWSQVQNPPGVDYLTVDISGARMRAEFSTFE